MFVYKSENMTILLLVHTFSEYFREYFSEYFSESLRVVSNEEPWMVAQCYMLLFM